MKLDKHQTTHEFTLDDGRQANLRIIYPSEPKGAWPGTKVTIREWMIWRHKGLFVPANKTEIIELETALGELPSIQFITHPTLGEVVLGEPSIPVTSKELRVVPYQTLDESGFAVQRGKTVGGRWKTLVQKRFCSEQMPGSDFKDCQKEAKRQAEAYMVQWNAELIARK
jgi:hypothetical protein